MVRKHIILAICPLLLFALLVVPYSWLNQNFLVDWLGCGCPQIDEFGNIYEPVFNANDFTACFWLAIAVIATIVSLFPGKRLFPDSILFRILYTVIVAAISLWIAWCLWRHMMWN